MNQPMHESVDHGNREPALLYRAILLTYLLMAVLIHVGLSFSEKSRDVGVLLLIAATVHGIGLWLAYVGRCIKSLLLGLIAAPAYYFIATRFGHAQLPVALWSVAAVLLTIATMALIVHIGSPVTAQPPQPAVREKARIETSPVPAAPLESPRLVQFPGRYPGKDFDDIHGMEDVKTRLAHAAYEIVVDDRAGERRSRRNGILLFGEPGNGKTHMAECLAGHLKVPIISIGYGDVASRWVNQTTETVVVAFRDAIAQAPCVLFIDEIDSLIRERHATPGDAEGPRITNAMLTEIVNLRDKRVVLIGATNHMDGLDTAAIREGRFDFKVEIPPPDAVARTHILLRALDEHLMGVNINTDALASVVKRWEGFSVKRLQAVVEALVEIDNESALNIVDLDAWMTALRRVQGRMGRVPEATKSLADMVLPQVLRRQLSTIATRMRDLDRVERLGGTVPAGLLFFGEPGTGKTETARALAKETGWAFLQVSGNDLVSAPSRIDDVVKQARDLRPAIVFIDEADDILAHRTGSYTASATNKLLAAMDGASGKVPDVVFIAATNHPEQVDAAALRGGRFTEKLFFSLPDQAGMEEFIARWIGRSKAPVDASVSPQEVARMMGDGIAIPTVEAILQEAVNQMIGRSEEDDACVTLEDVHLARHVILGREDT